MPASRADGQPAQGLLEPGQGNPCLGMQHRPRIGEHHQSLHRDPIQPCLPQMMPHIVHMGLVLQLGIVQLVGLAAHHLPQLTAVAGDLAAHMLGFHHQHPEAAEQQVVDLAGARIQGQVHVAAHLSPMLPGKPAQLCRHHPFSHSAPVLGTPVAHPEQQEQAHKPCGDPRRHL